MKEPKKKKKKRKEPLKPSNYHSLMPEMQTTYKQKFGNNLNSNNLKLITERIAKISSGLTSNSCSSPVENKVKQLPAGVGAGHVGTDVWNEKWKRYQKMKEFGRLNEKVNKMLY